MGKKKDGMSVLSKKCPGGTTAFLKTKGGVQVVHAANLNKILLI